MPVTARLSRKFYETFGDEIANELVDWFNQVDTAYRTELRELNELNFSRFDAKLEQRIGQLGAKLEQRIAEVKAELRQEIATLEVRLRSEMAAMKSELIRWMFLFWAGTTITLLGAVIALLRLG